MFVNSGKLCHYSKFMDNLGEHMEVQDSDKTPVKPKIDNKNEAFKRSSLVNLPIINEKWTWEASPKVDTRNEDFVPSQQKPMQVFSDTYEWEATPKVNTRNYSYAPAEHKPLRVCDEKWTWEVAPKVETRNDGFVPSKQKPLQVFSDSYEWVAEPKVVTRSNYQPAKPKALQVCNDSYDWAASAKVNTRNDVFIPSKQKALKVCNDNYKWTSASKIHTKNDSYEPPKQEILRAVNEKYKGKNAEGKCNTENDNDSPSVRDSVDDSNNSFSRSSFPKVMTRVSKSKRGGRASIHYEKLKWLSSMNNDAEKVKDLPTEQYLTAWDNVKAKVETQNPNFIPSVPHGMKIANDQWTWTAAAKIDALNKDYVPSVPKASSVKSEKLHWPAVPKIVAKNLNYIPASNLRAKSPVILDDKFVWDARPKVDTFNTGYEPPQSDVQIKTSTFNWKKNSESKVDSMRNIGWHPSVFNVALDADKGEWVGRKNSEWEFDPWSARTKETNETAPW